MFKYWNWTKQNWKEICSTALYIVLCVLKIIKSQKNGCTPFDAGFALSQIPHFFCQKNYFWIYWHLESLFILCFNFVWLCVFVHPFVHHFLCLYVNISACADGFLAPSVRIPANPVTCLPIDTSGNILGRWLLNLP